MIRKQCQHGNGSSSPSAKTDVSFPFDEGDTSITEVFASREKNDEVMNEKVESAIIDNDVEDGASISLKSGFRNSQYFDSTPWSLHIARIPGTTSLT